jgi:hypothetical protein
LKNSLKKLLSLLTVVALGTVAVNAQSTAMDFNRSDCNGVKRHLFADLDSGKAVIIEFFMINCAPCPAAGIKLEAMKNNLLTQYPGKIVSYAIAYNNTYTKTQVKNWVSSYSFNMIPMDSGAAQVAYYGGMGMPTIVVAGGKTTHSVLGSPYIGFNSSDTTQMAADIRALLGTPTNTTTTTGVEKQNNDVKGIIVFPNPADREIVVAFEPAAEGKFSFTLLDLQGRLIKDFNHGSDGSVKRSLPVCDVAPGNYLLQVRSGSTFRSKKVTISR